MGAHRTSDRGRVPLGAGALRVLIVSKPFVNLAYRQKLRELATLGVDVTAVSPPEWREAGSVQRLEAGDDDSYDLRVLPMRFNGHFHYHWYAGLPELLDDVRPTLVHIDEEPYNLATFLAARAARRRGISSIFFTWQNLLRRFPPPVADMERAVYRWSSLALAGSVDASEVLRTKGYSRPISVVPQFGVDPERFHPGGGPAGPFTVGYFNRLIPAKAPLETLRAFASLPADSRLLIVGDGPLRDDVLSLAWQLGVADRVELRSRVPSFEVPDLMRGAGVVVLPSLTTPTWKEQFGRVLIETMACGVPVVGSDSGEIPHVIGDAGLVTPEGDVDALGAALRRLHDDAALRADLGCRGRERVLQHFTHRRIAEATVRSYETALGG
jgi:glycosyltransferase involved in cell wall biosynthesis